ncbi:MAG: hypothetical protein MR016_05015 [Agathobacter sp.]|nr:hypothetical protein [Agathobacter sp.]
MNELAKRIVRGLLLVLCGAAISLLILSIRKTGQVQSKLNEVASQLSYLQDSTAMIQSDLHTMEENIETTLEEESSLIEDYSIQVSSVNLQEQTYDVDITILPKEYTEATQTSIYFGTRAYNLELQGLVYKGEATLSLKNNYDGNVTVLFTNGEKRSTEVLHNYVGFPTQLATTLSGGLANASDSYKDGTLEFDGQVSYELDGHNMFDFTSFSLVAEVNGENVYDYDLIRETGGAKVQAEAETQLQTEADIDASGEDSPNDAGDENIDAEEEQTADQVINPQADDAGADSKEQTADDTGTAAATEAAQQEEENLPDLPDASQTDVALQEVSVSGLGGEHDIHFLSPAVEGNSIKIYLKAATQDGYTFVFTLWEGSFTEDDNARAQEYLDGSYNQTVVDANGNIWNKAE